MSIDLSFVEGEYLRDILNQPQALDDTLEKLESSKALLNLAKRLNALQIFGVPESQASSRGRE